MTWNGSSGSRISAAPCVGSASHVGAKCRLTTTPPHTPFAGCSVSRVVLASSCSALILWWSGRRRHTSKTTTPSGEGERNPLDFVAGHVGMNARIVGASVVGSRSSRQPAVWAPRVAPAGRVAERLGLAFRKERQGDDPERATARGAGRVFQAGILEEGFSDTRALTTRQRPSDHATESDGVYGMTPRCWGSLNVDHKRICGCIPVLLSQGAGSREPERGRLVAVGPRTVENHNRVGPDTSV